MSPRRLGQHFLARRQSARRIVDALAPGAGEPLLEIGPGPGALTEPLIEAVGRIAAVELDPVLAARLERRFGESELLLLRANILRVSFADVLERLGASPRQRLVVAGNLPYNVSKPVAMQLVRERERTARAVLMFQREVAERLTAAPGTRAYGPLTVLAGEAYEIRRLFDLPPGAFRPPPKVTSTVTAWQPRPPGTLSEQAEQRLRRCLEACFAQRRRTLYNNLRAALRDDETAARVLVEAELDGKLRPEAIRPEQFRRLATLLPDAG